MVEEARMDTAESMKVYGYPQDQDLDTPLRMDEVTLVADPSTLRKLAAFLNYAADLMEQHGDQFGHEHFSDFTQTDRDGNPDFVISR
jgi:hypothetical protein